MEEARAPDDQFGLEHDGLVGAVRGLHLLLGDGGDLDGEELLVVDALHAARLAGLQSPVSCLKHGDHKIVGGLGRQRYGGVALRAEGIHVDRLRLLVVEGGGLLGEAVAAAPLGGERERAASGGVEDGLGVVGDRVEGVDEAAALGENSDTVMQAGGGWLGAGFDAGVAGGAKDAVTHAQLDDFAGVDVTDKRSDFIGVGYSHGEGGEEDNGEAAHDGVLD